MSRVIDRRLNSKNKSTVNRARFIRRFKNHIKKAVEESVSKRSITDIDKGEKINIPAKDLSEPIFHHGQGGVREGVHPGNKDFISGDRIKRPPQGGAGQGGGEASNTGEGEDNFGFEISREEFLEIFFEDLELPDLIKTQIAKVPSFKMVRAGVTNDGVPANLNIVRSMRNAIGRRAALGGMRKRKLKKAEQALAEALKSKPETDPEVIALKEKVERLRNQTKRIPFIDTVDLRYNNRVKREVPTTQAVMFCLMDVSGSMDEMKKDIAKRFFILLYLFLQRNYEHIEIVFIRHHTTAKEVDEEEFFYSRETGGTVVSSALEMMLDVIRKRYPSSEWNIYGAQASDGDNWNADSPHCRDLLLSGILPLVQYFAYVEIMPRHHQSLWEVYQDVLEQSNNFTMQHISNRSEIYPVFRELFKRQLA